MCKSTISRELIKELNKRIGYRHHHSFYEILKSYSKFIESVALEMSKVDKNLSYLYWIPKLHKGPFKHRFIIGSSKCATKDLSFLLIKMLTTIKDVLIRYCNTKPSCSGINSMWIIENSTSLLPSLDNLNVRTAASVQTYDCSTFSNCYTCITTLSRGDSKERSYTQNDTRKQGQNISKLDKSLIVWLNTHRNH